MLRNNPRSILSRPQLGMVRKFTNAAVEFKTSKFGELVVRSESICDISVKPIDPQLFPHQDKAFFDFQGNCDGLLDVACTSLDQMNRLSINKRNGCSYEVNEQRTCHASVPIKYG